MGSSWGMDLGGAKNTFCARVWAEGTRLAYEVFQHGGASLDLTRWLWGRTRAEGHPIVVAIDSVLSACLTNPSGWRPSDYYLRGYLEQRGLDANRVVSPSGFMGHRHLELAETFGAYALVVETHPTACLLGMGAPLAALRTYKKDAESCRQLVAWLRTGWLSDGPEIRLDGEVDAVVCALVAHAVGGWRAPGLKLSCITLGDPTARARAHLSNPAPDLPTTEVVGPAPFYLLELDEAWTVPSELEAFTALPEPIGIPDDDEPEDEGAELQVVGEDPVLPTTSSPQPAPEARAEHERACPAGCGKVFARWAFGADAHAKSTRPRTICSGIPTALTDPDARWDWYRSRFLRGRR